MSKPKVHFDDAVTAKSEEGDDPSSESKGWNRTFSKKHTLDSDEEDDVKEESKYVLHEEDVEGAEDETDIVAEGGIRLTPFNLTEEMSEGRFDAHGNYYENKEKEIHDNWLDNIDWMRYSNKTTEERRSTEYDGRPGSPELEPSRPEAKILSDIVGFLRPGETIARAVQRLGGGKKTHKGRSGTARKWGPKRAKTDEESGDSSEVDKESMLKLTGFVDELVASGNYEAYQYTYEKVTHQLGGVGGQGTKKDTGDVFDMFGDEPSTATSSAVTTSSSAAGKGKAAETGTAAETEVGTSEKQLDVDAVNGSGTKTQPDATPTSDLDPGKVYWEYKWQNEETVDKYGPFESQQMQEWVDQDFFADGVWVRKVGSEGPFYSSRRIDFDLYI